MQRIQTMLAAEVSFAPLMETKKTIKDHEYSEFALYVGRALESKGMDTACVKPNIVLAYASVLKGSYTPGCVKDEEPKPVAPKVDAPKPKPSTKPKPKPSTKPNPTPKPTTKATSVDDLSVPEKPTPVTAAPEVKAPEVKASKPKPVKAVKPVFADVAEVKPKTKAVTVKAKVNVTSATQEKLLAYQCAIGIRQILEAVVRLQSEDKAEGNEDRKAAVSGLAEAYGIIVKAYMESTITSLVSQN